MSGIDITNHVDGCQSSAHPTASINRIKGLDGLRAVAVVLVLVTHAVNHHDVVLPLVDGTILGAAIRGMGRYGVLIFFVLSGYLITTLLAREQKRHGSINLRRFWSRRVFRILPVFYACLVVTFFLTAAGVLDLRPRAFLAAGTFLWNYNFILPGSQSLGTDSAALGHYWTLAVEEQFYIIFPIIFFLAGPMRTTALCATLVLLAPAIRVGQYFAMPSLRIYVGIMAHTVIGGSIAIGCLWALCESSGLGLKWRRALTTRFAVLTATVFGFVIHPLLSAKFAGAWELPIGESLASVAAMIMIASATATSESSLGGRVLNYRPIVWLGTISYSVYIWQQVFYHVDLPGFSISVGRFVATGLAILAATCSYYLLELPFLRIRDRLWMDSRPGVAVSPIIQAVTL